jgi:predicted Na+-dependent transporter
VLLITPAAYHRLVEQGEETEHFHRFASKVLVAALVPLALGLAGDVYVVVQKVTESPLVSVVSALVILAIFWELWFGLTLYRRTQRRYAD